MPNKIEIDVVRKFVAQYRGKMILSTGAQVIDFPGDLYNVTGSTKDPKAVRDYKGLAWKALLKKYPEFTAVNCYVTNPLPTKSSSHPGFNVGGHMTPNPSGVVQYGAESYLIPLCKWHNSTRRNGVAFSHSNTKVLKLTGYMQGDAAITFALRMDNDNKHTILFRDSPRNGWNFTKLSDAKKQDFDKESFKSILPNSNFQEYAIFEKLGEGFVITSSNIEV